MHLFKSFLLVVAAVALTVAPAGATLIGVSGPDSFAFELPPEIIAAPANALNSMATNGAMQGFDEAQGVLLGAPISTDGGTIAAGTLVSSHMIFLNSPAGIPENYHLGNGEVEWTFDGIVLGVMSDINGTLEGASTGVLGNPGTNYEVFANRGLESNDYYTVVGNQITVKMRVTQPGDWIRVVTAAAVPEPGTLMLVGLGLIALGARRKD